MNRRSTILATVMVSLAVGALAFIAISMTHAPGVQASISYQAATTTTPTGTTTAVPTTAPTAVATRPPLAAYPAQAPVSRFTATRQGSTVRFSWRTTSHAGFKGFRVYAAAHQLTRSLIRAHSKLSYHYSTHWSGAGPFMLHVVLPDGQQLVVPTS